MRVKAPLATLVLLLALAGCGSGDEGEPESALPGRPGQPGTEAPRRRTKAAEAPKPAGHSQPKQGSGSSGDVRAASSPRVKRLRQNFPKPVPASGAKQASAKAIADGEEACEGLTPTEVKERFYDEAEASLDPEQRALAEELPRYEEEAPDDPSFVAGQVAATIYGATLSEAEGTYGFQGCVYSLARGLEGRL